MSWGRLPVKPAVAQSGAEDPAAGALPESSRSATGQCFTSERRMPQQRNIA